LPSHDKSRIVTDTAWREFLTGQKHGIILGLVLRSGLPAKSNVQGCIEDMSLNHTARCEQLLAYESNSKLITMLPINEGNKKRESGIK